jgi:hypothetical protein
MNSKVKDSKVLAAFKPGEQLDTAQVLSRVHCMSWAQVYVAKIRLEKRGYLGRVYDDIYVRYPYQGDIWTEGQREEAIQFVRKYKTKRG